MAAGIARAPQANALRVDDVLVFEEADRAPPIGDLTPWVDILARRAVTGAEVAVIVQEDDKAVGGEFLGESLQAGSFTPA